MMNYLEEEEETNDIQQVSLEHLHSFENHPFQVNDDEAMAELVESVEEEGNSYSITGTTAG
mgnify:CR=1 FL=1